MYFLDHSGHIFELNDYSTKPIGYEYDEQDYIFGLMIIMIVVFFQ